MRKFGLLGLLAILLLGNWEENLLLRLWQAVRPVFAGAIVAAFLWPICRFVEEKLPIKREPLRRAIALFGIGGGFVLLAAAAVWLLIPALKNSIAAVGALVSDVTAVLPEGNETLQKAAAASLSLLEGGGLGEKLTKTAGSVLDLLTGVTVAFLLLYRRREMVSGSKVILEKLLGQKRTAQIIQIAKTTVSVFGSFFLGQLTEALVIGGGCFLFLLLFSFPYRLEIALLVAVTAIIPVAGAIIGTVVGCLVLLTHSLRQAVVFLLFMLLLQGLENFLIYPRVVGKTIGLSTLATLTAVIVGGKLFGAAGILFFVPFLGTLKSLLSRGFFEHLADTAEEAA